MQLVACIQVQEVTHPYAGAKGRKDLVAKESEQVWIKANDAIESYAHFFGGKKALRDLLAEGLRDGAIRSRARIKGKPAEKSIRKAWRLYPQALTPFFELPTTPVALSKGFWRSSERWNDDKSEWRWVANLFSITYKEEPRRRWLVRGVQFALSDVKAFLTDA